MVPEKIVTDNGKEFTNNKIKKFCKKIDVELLHGRARHSQTQGVVERYNRTINYLLKNAYLDAKINNKVFNLEKELSDVMAIHQIFYLIVKMILYKLK